MIIKNVTILGLELEEWKFASCIAHFGVGTGFATLYDIETKEQCEGHATQLLKKAKQHYESQGKKFGGSVALSPAMKHIYQKLGIKEYK